MRGGRQLAKPDVARPLDGRVGRHFRGPEGLLALEALETDVGRRGRCLADTNLDDGGKARTSKKRRLMRKDRLCYECSYLRCVDARWLLQPHASDLLALTFEEPVGVAQICAMKKEERDPFRIACHRNERLGRALAWADGEHQGVVVVVHQLEATRNMARSLARASRNCVSMAGVYFARKPSICDSTVFMTPNV